MSRDTAVAKARTLRGYLLAVGVKTVSIELVEGRGGSGWDKPTHVASMGHHTVSRRSQGDTPCLKLVKVGRSDLPGPLCNGYGGFDEVARIICMSWANHPGAGGPYWVEAGTVPENNGRPYFFGWEFEGGLDLTDFTPSYREFMARCHAGTLNYLLRTPLSHIEHKTWAEGRKTDRLAYSLETARTEINQALEETVNINPGERGNYVRVYQQALNGWAVKQSVPNWTPLAEDGMFGTDTEQAVRLYQRAAQVDTKVPRLGALDDLTRDLLERFVES